MAFLSLVGLVLVWGGIRLVVLGGSAYYLVSGFALIAAAVLLFGIWPQPLVHLMDASVGQLVQKLAYSKV